MKKETYINGYNVTNPKTQAEKVLVYLLKNKSITSWIAIEKFRATRLSSIIFNLRCHFNIESKDTTVNGKWFTTYIYRGDMS